MGKKKTVSTGVLGALGGDAFSDEGAAAADLFTAAAASLPPAPPQAAAAAAANNHYDDALDRVMGKRKGKGKHTEQPKQKASRKAWADAAAEPAAEPAKKRRKEKVPDATRMPPKERRQAPPAPAAPAEETETKPDVITPAMVAAWKGLAPGAADEAPAERDAGPAAAARTVFVGNLPREATKKQLDRFFRPYGAVASSRKRSVAVQGCAVDANGDDKLVQSVCARTGQFSDAKRTTNGYVVFADVAGARDALRANGSVWTVPGSMNEEGVETPPETFHLRVDLASGERGDQEHLRTAFVGNAPRDTSEEGLRELFAVHLQESGGHACVENVRVVRDKEHRCVGVAYVLLRDRAVLGEALDLDGVAFGEAMDPRPLRVQTCGKRTKTHGQPHAAAGTKKAPASKKAAFGARRRMEKKARRTESRAGKANATGAPKQTGGAPAAAWQGKRAADTAKGAPSKKKGKTGVKKTFVGKRKK
jgi:nucleolar protein 12